MTVLITFFSPFGGDKLNASQEVMHSLPDQIGEADIVRLCLPVVFGKASDIAIEAAGRIHPDAIVCLGQAGGREAVTPERAALNIPCKP